MKRLAFLATLFFVFFAFTGVVTGTDLENIKVIFFGSRHETLVKVEIEAKVVALPGAVLLMRTEGFITAKQEELPQSPDLCFSKIELKKPQLWKKMLLRRGSSDFYYFYSLYGEPVANIGDVQQLMEELACEILDKFECERIERGPLTRGGQRE